MTSTQNQLFGAITSINNTFVGVGRNRFINGAMWFDQMNAGNTFTIDNLHYSQDQFFASFSGTGAWTSQRLTATPPTGFTHYMRMTVTTTEGSLASSSNYIMRNGPEGTMLRDFLLGTANAVTFTLSFWVRSSVTGTYSVSFQNSAHNRSYIATYTINSANTWEQKTLTVVGDTSGTWAIDSNSFGMRVIWSLGAGSTFQATAGSWQNGQFFGTSGSTNLLATNGATLDLTGCQLEIGSVVTPFEFRPFGLELALCQRYYEKSYDLETAPGTVTSTNSEAQTTVQINTNTMSFGMIPFKVAKRGAPTVTLYSRVTGTAGNWTWRTQTGGTSNERATGVDTSMTRGFNGNQAVNSVELLATGHWTADAGF